MIGTWLKFGDGPDPENGEAVVWISFEVDIETALYDVSRGSMRFAVFRHGALHGDDGSIMSAPYGAWWTSLPPPTARGDSGGPVTRWQRAF